MSKTNNLRKVHKDEENLKKMTYSILKPYLKDFSVIILTKSNFNSKQVKLVQILILLQPKKLILREDIRDKKATLSKLFLYIDFNP